MILLAWTLAGFAVALLGLLLFMQRSVPQARLQTLKKTLGFTSVGSVVFAASSGYAFSGRWWGALLGSICAVFVIALSTATAFRGREESPQAPPRCLICHKDIEYIYTAAKFSCTDCGFRGYVHDSCRMGGLQPRAGVMTLGSLVKIRCPECGAT